MQARHQQQLQQLKDDGAIDEVFTAIQQKYFLAFQTEMTQSARDELYHKSKVIADVKREILKQAGLA